ncbi:MAG: hypothetical protein JSV16_07695 [Candidatus Hydrogenedentota bacterium]|nr:MAG: hypothetical protein JSV16_07695 [Candidatus Hydrogenedentota bacterium]
MVAQVTLFAHVFLRPAPARPGLGCLGKSAAAAGLWANWAPLGMPADAAAQRLARALADTPIAATAVIRNIDAKYYPTADGIQTLYEIGPGRTLTGLIKRINRKTNTTTINSTQTINTLLAALA